MVGACVSRRLVGSQVTRMVRVLRVTMVVHFARQDLTTFCRQIRKRLVTPHCDRALREHTASEHGAPLLTGGDEALGQRDKHRLTMRARQAWKRDVTPQIRRERFTHV